MKVHSFLDYPTLLSNHARPVHLALQLQAGSSTGAQPQPVAFSFVLDRSGSMAGEPLAAARKAAALAVRHLRPHDHFALVVFDDKAQTLIPLQPADRKATFLKAIAQIGDGGSTNLTAGWMLGRDALRDAPPGSRRRLLLLSDGQLNVGIVEPGTVRGIVAAGLEKDAIRTSCLGFGDRYDEDLLSGLARATNGEFHDASSPEKFPGIIAAELEGLQQVVIQNLRLRLQPLDFCDGIVALGGYPSVSLPDGRTEFALGDLVADEERVVCFGLQVLPLPAIDGRPAFSIDGESLVGIELLYDELTPQGIASKVYTQTVRIRATQDPGEVRANGEVIQWVAVQRAGVVSEQVTRLMDAADADQAQRVLDQALLDARALGEGPGVEDAVRSLERLRDRIGGGGWDLRERKMAIYRAQSHQRMSSATPWCLEEPAPSFKIDPSSTKNPPKRAWDQKAVNQAIREAVLLASRKEKEKRPFRLFGKGHEDRVTLDWSLAAVLRGLKIPRVHLDGFGAKYRYPKRVFKRAARNLKGRLGWAPIDVSYGRASRTTEHAPQPPPSVDSATYTVIGRPAQRQGSLPKVDE